MLRFQQFAHYYGFLNISYGKSENDLFNITVLKPIENVYSIKNI